MPHLFSIFFLLFSFHFLIYSDSLRKVRHPISWKQKQAFLLLSQQFPLKSEIKELKTPIFFFPSPQIKIKFFHFQKNKNQSLCLEAQFLQLTLQLSVNLHSETFAANFCLPCSFWVQAPGSFKILNFKPLFFFFFPSGFSVFQFFWITELLLFLSGLD